MYSSMTMVELRTKLRNRNESIVGKRDELIKRLEACDSNQMIGDDWNSKENSSYYICPPADTFKDIKVDSPIPNISMQIIQDSFQRFNALHCGRLLYESYHLANAQYSCDGKYTYLRGQCLASKKNDTLYYLTDVKVSQDGAILECRCECVAENVATIRCKHAAMLLLSAHDIVTNQTIKLQNTEQKFIQPLPREYQPFRESDIMDNYEDYVRNLVINYGESTMPILQLFKSAKQDGIALDHSYTSDGI